MFTTVAQNNRPALKNCRKNYEIVDFKRISTEHTLPRAAVGAIDGFRFMTFWITADMQTCITRSNIPKAHWHLEPPKAAEEIWPVHYCVALQIA